MINESNNQPIISGLNHLTERIQTSWWQRTETPGVPGPSWCKWVHPGRDTWDAIWGWWLLCLSGNRPHNGCLHSTSHYFPSCWSWRTLPNCYFLILFHCRIITRGWEEAMQRLQAFHRGQQWPSAETEMHCVAQVLKEQLSILGIMLNCCPSKSNLRRSISTLMWLWNPPGGDPVWVSHYKHLLWCIVHRKMLAITALKKELQSGAACCCMCSTENILHPSITHSIPVQCHWLQLGLPDTVAENRHDGKFTMMQSCSFIHDSFTDTFSYPL